MGRPKGSTNKPKETAVAQEVSAPAQEAPVTVAENPVETTPKRDNLLLAGRKPRKMIADPLVKPDEAKIAAEYDYDDAPPAEEEEGATDDTGADSAEKESTEDVGEPQTDIDDELLNIAAEFGIEREDALSFKDAATLSKVLLTVSRSRKQPAADESGNGNGRAEKKEGGASDDIELKELDDEELSPAITGAIKKIKTFYDKKIEELRKEGDETRGRLRSVTEQVGAAQEANFYRELDNKIAALGEPYKEIFGEGPTLSLRPGPALTNRKKLIEDMKVTVSGFMQTNPRAMPSGDEIFHRSKNALFAGKVAGKTQEKDKQKLLEDAKKSAARGLIQKPSAGQAPISADARAKANIKAKLKAAGLDTDEIEIDEEL